MATDLEGAVERLKQSRDRARQSAERGDIFDPSPALAAMAIEASRYANAIDTTLDALASITRERDEAREESERLRERAKLDWGDILNLAERATKVEAERDAMLEGLEPFAAIGREAERSGFTQRDHEGAWGFNCINVTWGDFRRASALVNGEVG